MKTTYLCATLVAVGLSLALASPAKAGDYNDSKGYAGSGCKVFGDTAWTDLQFGATGIKNKTSTPKNIICPIPKDADSAWDGTSTAGAMVLFHVRTGNRPMTSTCNFYSVDSQGTIDYTVTTPVGGYANVVNLGGTG